VISSDPNSSSDGLSERQSVAIGLLIAGKTHTAVASQLGIDRRTVWAWKQEPAFAAALNAEQQAIRDAAQSRAIALADKAYDALERVLDHADSDSAVVVVNASDIQRLGDMHRERLKQVNGRT
jgi:hypothetical protein